MRAAATKLNANMLAEKYNLYSQSTLAVKLASFTCLMSSASSRVRTRVSAFSTNSAAAVNSPVKPIVVMLINDIVVKQ